MAEIDREAVLYERAQARLAKAERRELERKMRALEANSLTRPARAPTASMEKKRKTLDELKARRERRKHRGSDSDYSGDEYGQEDGEVDINKSSAVESEEEDYYRDTGYNKFDSRKPLATLKSSKRVQSSTAQLIDLDTANRLRLSRDTIAKWIFHPQFDDLARGCLLRLSIGFKGEEQVYRLVEVRKIALFHRNYKINGTTTNKAAILKYGKNEKTFCLDIISNSAFTQKEFDRWTETMKEEHQPIVTMRAAESRIQAWRELEARPLSDDIISAMVAAKRELGAAPRNLVAERTMLLHLKDEATSCSNKAELERIETELVQLDGEMALQSSRSAPESRFDALAELNRRNRRSNVVSARDAERKNLKRSEADNKLDPFSRRKCQPTNFNVLFDSNANTPVLEIVSSLPDAQASLDEMSAEEDGSHADEKILDQKMDLFAAAHNVDIDIDI